MNIRLKLSFKSYYLYFLTITVKQLISDKRFLILILLHSNLLSILYKVLLLDKSNKNHNATLRFSIFFKMLQYLFNTGTDNARKTPDY